MNPGRKRQDNPERMKLHKLGYSDYQIAEMTGTTQATILSWRRVRGLPRLSEQRVKGKNKVKLAHGGVPMEKALTPGQCEDMRMFLSALALAARHTRRPDVGAFIRAYRKVTI